MRFLTGFILGIILIPVVVYCYFRFGYAPVATAASPIPFEKTLAHMGLDAQIEKYAPKSAPFQASVADLENGAHLYRQNCAFCHGIMDAEKPPAAKGMYPAPPLLLHGKGVTDDPPGETYWKVANGIRLTGMPAYGHSMSDHEMWQISLLLAGADKLPAEVQSLLKQPLHSD
ncbi:MAG: cytochrome c [Acidobacteriaceae bacterium]|nr:cytochrome c [Acidobacteriaceae bacterium]MBV9297331.1 cytochrome c [Acidobacteriaceae bacterium]MBV9767077.1 cytochrome c [Acidobacteriaceae bacterium]